MREGSVMIELSDFSWVICRKEPFPVSFLMSLHMVEIDTGWFRPVMNELQDCCLAERTRTLALARAFL